MDKKLINKLEVKLLIFAAGIHNGIIDKKLMNETTDAILDLILSAGYVQQWGKCPACHSDGKDHYLLRCDGKGIIRNVDHCPTCNGTGRVLRYAELADKGKNE